MPALKISFFPIIKAGSLKLNIITCNKLTKGEWVITVVHPVDVVIRLVDAVVQSVETVSAPIEVFVQLVAVAV